METMQVSNIQGVVGLGFVELTESAPIQFTNYWTAAGCLGVRTV